MKANEERNRMKKLVALLLTGIMLFALGGCGAADFDAKGYVKAALDAKFHREYDEYADVIGVSKEEARKQMEDEFNESLKTSMNESGLKITDAEMEEYLKLEAELRTKVKYEVKKASKDKEGNFTVDVIITPVLADTNLQTIFSNKLTAAVQNGATESQYMATFLEAMKECVANAESGEAVTMTLHVKWTEKDKQKVYQIDEKEWLKLDSVAMGKAVE